MDKIREKIFELAENHGPINFGPKDAEWLLEGSRSASLWWAEDADPATAIKAATDELLSNPVSANKIAFLLFCNEKSEHKLSMQDVMILNEAVKQMPDDIEWLWGYLYDDSLDVDNFRIYIIEVR